MNLKKLFLFLVIILSLFYSENLSEKIIIKISEKEEEVPYYKSFSILIENPTEEDKTLIGYFEFENQEKCHFYAELPSKTTQEIIRHCFVKKKRLKYTVKIEKVYPFIIKE